jgi:hypothetical protein
MVHWHQVLTHSVGQHYEPYILTDLATKQIGGNDGRSLSPFLNQVPIVLEGRARQWLREIIGTLLIGGAFL